MLAGARLTAELRDTAAPRLALPDRFLRATADNAPETRSERMFDALGPGERVRGLKSAIAAVRERRRSGPALTMR